MAINTFHLQMENIVSLTLGKQHRIVEYVIKGMDEQVVMRSPVDTGRFKGNWQLGVDYQPTEKLERYDKDGRETIDMNNAKIPYPAYGHDYYLVNNLDYAQALEDGHSRFSPPGNLVHDVVVDLQRFVDEAVRNERT